MRILFKKISIKKDNHTEGLVSLPQSIENEDIHTLSFSQVSCGAEFKKSSHHDLLVMSHDIWDKLGLPMEQDIHYVIHEQTLQFLPLVGVFTTLDNSNFIHPFGQRTAEISKLLSYAKKYGVFMFVFSPEQIRFEDELISGLFYENGKWVSKTIPFPQVIYDRIPNRRTERKDMIQEVKNRLAKDYRIPWFNTGFFSKWEVYRKLDIHATSSQYLPETIEQPSKQKIAAFLEKYGQVFIKPKNSSRGLGIQQIIQKEDGVYCRFHEKGQNKLRRYKTLEDLMTHQLDEELYPHLILQQGIQLLEYENRPFDFRIHTNKDARGQWQVSAIAAKVAGEGSVTTHVTYGGEIKTLHELFADKAKDYLDKLSRVSIMLSKIIEQQLDGDIGELGLDIGIDNEERIWLFEANAKPGHIIFTPRAMKKQEAYSRKILFDYFMYLAQNAEEHMKHVIQAL